MRFPSMLRRMRNAQAGTRSTARSASTPYTPYMPQPPDPPMPDPPVANAGSNQTVLVGDTVGFDGSGSTGNNLSYSWAFGTGATPATGSGVMPSCSYSTTGTKVVTLTVTDNAGATARDTVTITVHDEFVIDAGSNQTVLVNEPVNFAGSVSNAPDGVNLTYSWAFDDGVDSATVSGLTASCVYNTPGDKTVALTVSYTDANGDPVEVFDEVTITVHSAPICQAGSDQTVLVGETVNFDGSGSSDPDGGELIYSWAFGTDATPATGSGEMPSCTYSTIGTKTVTLTVTDDEGATASDTVTITVHKAPIADAGSDQRVAVGSEATFNGSGSSDPDGGNLTYSWDFGADADPETAEGVMPFCIYSARGAKTVILTVTDDEGATASDTVTINVYNPPVADAGNNQTVAVGTEVSFDGSGSRDPDGGVLTYSWEFGDAEDPTAIGSEVTASHTYSTIGDKTVTLTVTDDEEAMASHTVIITVFKVDAGDAQRVFVGKRVNFTGTIENAPADATFSYSWDFGHDATDAEDDDGLTPSCTYTMGGSKTVELTVSYTVGGEVVEASDTVTITVIEVGVALSGMPRVVAVGGNGTRVSFEGTVSNAPADATLSYTWDFGEGAIYLRRYGSTASCIYTMPGVKTVKLTVGVTIDGQEVQVEGTCVIEVFKVDAGSYQVAGVNDPVSFEGTVLDAPADATPTYSWDFGEGAMPATGSTLRASCSYTTAGDKTVKLTVSFTIDGESVEGSGTIEIRVAQLRVQGPRGLSPLEQAAFNLVFGATNTIERPEIEVVAHIDNLGDPGGPAGSYDAFNDIVTIARDKHAYTEDLDGDTTVNDIDLTRPDNIKYLATLIHEAVHHWQSIKNRYPTRIPNYKFDNAVLETLTFECKEQHAAVGQVYFILKWQLHHGHDPINLTDGEGSGDNVGPASRYASIAAIPLNSGHRYIDPPEAILLVNNFDGYLADLRVP